MVEIDNPLKRAEALSKMGGFEETFTIKIADKLVSGKAELDVDRTTADGKASSVQFIHFSFTEEDIKIIRDDSSKIELSINHRAYVHSTTLQNETKDELNKDFY